MNRPWSQDQYLAAIRFAAEAHNGQTITGTNLPYLLHLNLVAMEVLAALATETTHDGELAIGCALLHDVIEDTHSTYAEVAERFGGAVANGVLALTKDATLPKDQQMADSLKRIQQQPSAVWMVKLADRICNLQPPPKHWSVTKIENYRDEAQLIHEQLGNASPFLAERLCSKIANYPG
jgi:(p)ppGpp synthase/HD superfamily hydrolase